MYEEGENVIDLGEKRKQKQRKSKTDKEQEKEDLLAAAELWLDEKKMREVLKLGCYFVRKENGQWIPIKRTHFGSHYPEWTAKFARAVTAIMEMRKWSFLDATYSFNPTVPSDTFNMLSTDGWLQPDVGKYHWLFDVLIQSLGGDRPLNMEHIEEVLVYKYLYPQTYTLPCLLIHGEGGVGKNVLVDIVLHTLFDGQTFSGTAKKILGDFNETLKGKTVVMINESQNDTTNENELKDMLGSARITINDKGVSKYEIDNTPLYIISSNASEGGVWLDRSQADRRYSVLNVKKGQSLPYWIALHEGDIPPDQTFLDKSHPIHKKWEKWMLNEGGEILSDRTDIARWFGSIFLKHGEKNHPLPLHGEDFDRLMDIQKPMDERVFEAVFNDDEFDHIERQVLHKGYASLCDDAGMRGYLKEMKFYTKLRDWIDRLNIIRRDAGKAKLIETQVRVTEYTGGETKETRPRVWIAADRVEIGGNDQVKHKSTRYKYVRDVSGSFGKPRWVWAGPEV